MILLIGLAVGVDYALFYVARCRQERRAGAAPGQALEITSRTSGHTVVISGSIVALAMAGMFVPGMKVLNGIAAGTIAVIACAVAGSVTVLPAVLTLLGPKIDAGRVRLPRGRRGHGGPRRPSLADRMLRRPLAAASLATALLLALACLALSLHMAEPGAIALTAPDDPALQTLAAVQNTFPGVGEPAYVVVQVPAAGREALSRELARLQALAAGAGIAHPPFQITWNTDRVARRAAGQLNCLLTGGLRLLVETFRRPVMTTDSILSQPGAPVSRGGQTARTALRIAAPPPPVLVDDPRVVVVSGCAPGSPVVVTARVEMPDATREARASFRADAAGTVDTGRDTSLAGTYTGVDPFGLWWSGDPVAGPAGSTLSPVSARVRVESGGRTAEAAVARLWLAPGATVTEVREPGVWGLFARPAGSGPFPAVIAFGGSGGGLGPAAAWAPVLASHGIAALAIGYFGAPGLPETLVGIDVEVVERAAEWLLRRPDVAPGPIAVMGQSRGSELALLAGALLEPTGPVVAFTPSGVCWAGIGAHGPVTGPAWRFRGDDIPCADIGPAGTRLPAGAHVGPVISMRPRFEAMLRDRDAVRAAEIPVERVKGPILMVSGEADEMWPATAMADIAVHRAAARGFTHKLTHLRYPTAGHLCGGVPGTPTVTENRIPLTGLVYRLGGTPAGNAQSRADSWPQVLQLLLNQTGPK